MLVRYLIVPFLETAEEESTYEEGKRVAPVLSLKMLQEEFNEVTVPIFFLLVLPLTPASFIFIFSV